MSMEKPFSGEVNNEKIVIFSKDIDEMVDKYLEIRNNMTRAIQNARLRSDDVEEIQELTKRLDSRRRDAHNELANAMMRKGIIERKEGISQEEASRIAREEVNDKLESYETLRRFG